MSVGGDESRRVNKAAKKTPIKASPSAQSGGEISAPNRQNGLAVDEMDVVLSISLALAGKFDLPSLVGSTLAKVETLVGTEAASVLLIDPQTEHMSFYVAEGPGAEVAMTIPLPPGAGICGHVARSGEALIVNDAQHDPRLYRSVDDATGFVTRNILCVPIRTNERPWGVLELINKFNESDFDAQDQRIAEIVASLTGLALENTQLHTDIVRSERMAAVGQTVSGLAHCIKNILNGIRSGGAVLDRAFAENDFDRVGAGWQTVRRNNQMLSNLVLDMLALARESEPHAFPTDVNDLTEQVCALLADNAAERGLTITAVPTDNLEEVLVDPTHFYRCLLNLVSNALDACQDNGHVRVRVFRNPGRSRFTVSITDNGQGISRENAAKLFAEFFSTKGGRGTGLGLPVTKKLITQMGGTITFHSVLSRGTRFVFALPIPDAPTES